MAWIGRKANKPLLKTIYNVLQKKRGRGENIRPAALILSDACFPPGLSLGLQ